MLGETTAVAGAAVEEVYVSGVWGGPFGLSWEDI